MPETEAIQAEAAMLAGLDGCAWASRLVDNITSQGGILPFMHELRFAHALRSAGIEPVYEAPGAPGSSIDFAFASGGIEWRVELKRLVPAHERQDAKGFGVAEDERLHAIEMICGKLSRDGQPYKFLEPLGQVNVLLVDVSGLTHGDEAALQRIAFGDGDDRFPPLSRPGFILDGVLSRRTEAAGAAYVRERLHVLAFARPAHGRDLTEDGEVLLAMNPALVYPAMAERLVKAWPGHARLLRCSVS